MRRAALLTVLVTAAVLGVPGGAAHAAPGNQQCAQPGTAYAPVPWAQDRLTPEALWPVADGSGVRVAVVASGVDARHPQLAGRVTGGKGLIPQGSTTGDTDCAGLGTQVAGVVAARRSTSVGFHGLAPRATIVPIAVTEQDVVGVGSGSGATTPAMLGAAVRAAISQRVDVIVVPVVTYVDDPALRSAVAAAVDKDIVVVAGVGAPRKPEDGPGVPYPAAYEGVLGVGAVDEAGELSGDSAPLPYTDVVAPGVDLVSTQRGGGIAPVAGTGIAAGYVAGAATLVRSRWRSASAKEVVRRLLATAIPLAGGQGYGWGMVSPAQALSETMADGGPSPMPSRVTKVDTAEARQASEDAHNTKVALLVTGALAVVALLVVMLAVALPRGRRRRWRPGIAPPLADDDEDDTPSPPVLLFEDRM